MAAIQPITDFQIGRDNYRSDFELFQDWILDLRLAVVDGKPIATGKRAMPLWHNVGRVEVDPMAETCKASPDGGLVGPAARLERIAMLTNNYGLGEVYEHEYTINHKLVDILAPAFGDVDTVSTAKIEAKPLDWGAESVKSL